MSNKYILPPLPGPSSSIPSKRPSTSDRGNRPTNRERPLPQLPPKQHSRSKSSSESMPSSTSSRGMASGTHHRHRSQAIANVNQSSGSSFGTRQPPPRINKLLSAVLTAPISPVSPTRANPNATDVETVMVDGAFTAVPVSQTVTRPPSPTPTADYSIISPPSPTSFVHILPPSFAQAGLEGGAYDVFASPTSGPEGTPTCTFFVSPARPSQGSTGHHTRSQTYGPSASSSLANMRRSPSRIGRATLGRIWNVLSSPSKRTRFRTRISADVYSDLPLDGEEGELIDEACYIAVSSSTGIDIVSFLPPEVALHLLSFLDLQSILACRSVCRKWKGLSSDSLIWRELFYAQQPERGWKIDERRARCVALERTRARGRLSSSTSAHSPTLASPVSPRAPVWEEDSDASLTKPAKAPLSLDWEELYKTRMELDRRWEKGEPKVMKITGHEDSVYCLEFDSKKIVTGSRDRSIKIWDLQTGKLRFTLRGHAGSVLCLKFDKYDDVDASASSGESDPELNIDPSENDGLGTGFMVSGSSDCTMLVWDLNKLWKSGKREGGPELVRRVLKGHTGGVLDLKICRKWIVSCSKDTLIRVWNRQSLDLETTLRGHEGPVNAVGLQGDRLVSASGDGKMMLWDIPSGKRIRTFEGHDRGLACIEYKDDLIVSGSNDCKIKLWRASTGECLRTLTGHDLLVRALAFNPSSHPTRLVSASYDRSVKVWDLTTGKVVREFRGGHTSHVFDVKFDVRRVVSTSHDQKVVVMDFGTGLDTGLFL